MDFTEVHLFVLLVFRHWDNFLSSIEAHSFFPFVTRSFGFASFGHHLGLMDVYSFSFLDNIVGSF